MKRFSFVLLLIMALVGSALAQESEETLVPAGEPGEIVYVAFPVEITLDGDLSDWAGIPTYTVDKGPSPSSDPAENGSFTFAVAADAENFYITMMMPDQNIIAGQHEAN